MSNGTFLTAVSLYSLTTSLKQTSFYLFIILSPFFSSKWPQSSVIILHYHKNFSCWYYKFTVSRDTTFHHNANDSFFHHTVFLSVNSNSLYSLTPWHPFSFRNKYSTSKIFNSEFSPLPTMFYLLLTNICLFLQLLCWNSGKISLHIGITCGTTLK